MSESNPVPNVSARNAARYAWRKAPRSFSSKSRKGCKTCKIRRIKCDLTEPYCQKCTSTGRECDGYPQDPPLAPKSNNTLDVIAPRHAYNPLLPEEQPYGTGPIPPSLGSALFIYSTGSKEYLAINFFNSKTLPQLTGCRRSTSWVSIVMLFSNTVQAIHHAAVALGSLHRWYLQEKVNETPHDSNRNNEPMTNEFALYHYNLAIRRLLNHINQAGDSTTNTLITLLVCYLFTCFDNLAGNYKQASKHLKSGIKLLTEARVTIKKNGTTLQLPSSADLMRQLTEQYRHLDMQAATFLRDWYPQVLLDEETTPQPVLGPPDYQISSLGQAADVFEDLIPQVMVMRNWDTRFMHAGDSDTVLGSAVYYETLRKFLRWRAQMVGQIEAWSAAFATLLEPASSQLSASDTRLAQMLQLHYLTASSYLLVSLERNEMAFDNALPYFKMAVALGSALAVSHNAPFEGSAPDPEPGFTLEMGMIPAMYLMGVKCRDPQVRREIIAVLRRHPRREAMWDSVSAANVIEGAMELEEGGDPDFELGLKTISDITLDKRVTSIQWGPENGMYGSSGEPTIVVYEMCMPDGEHTLIPKKITL
ncbi:hypothetical protein M426DRAFT_325014 [Hypoxylon sp. CI-4A]|nr:hypothetical protein M426DRAFT_325014 [Hypoxylon sp. CI-4A]